MNIYHHVGIYSFRYESLKKFISMPPSKMKLKKIRTIKGIRCKNDYWCKLC